MGLRVLGCWGQGLGPRPEFSGLRLQDLGLRTLHPKSLN